MNDIIPLLDTFVGSYNDSKCYEFNGMKVPRVTAIISKCIHDDGFLFWANSLGFKHLSYNKTINFYADIGTQCHNAIDDFLDDETSIMPADSYIEAKNAYESFLKWFNDIHVNAKVEVIMHEKPLICKYFGGTLDGLYRINNKIYLVDYKTSNHVTFRYCLQLAAYRYMLRELHGINIDGCIIVQLSKSEVAYNEYVLNFDTEYDLKFANECEQAFLSLVYAYYNIANIESGFKLLNW